MNDVSWEQDLSDDELGELSAFLKNMGTSPYDLDNLESVDGFFCALICVPGQIDPSGWLMSMAKRGFVFTNPAYEARIMDLLIRYWNTVARNLCLITTEPLIFIEKYSHMWGGHDWSRGFISGLVQRPMFWSQPTTRKGIGDLFMPMVLLTADLRHDPNMYPPVISPEKREMMFPQALMNLTIIYSDFESLRRASPVLLNRRDDRQEGPLFVYDTQQSGHLRALKLLDPLFGKPNIFDAEDFRTCKFFAEDTDDFPLKCPACYHEFLVKVGSLTSRTSPPCPNCGLHTRGEKYYLDYALTNHHYLTQYMDRFNLIKYDKNIKQFRKLF